MPQLYVGLMSGTSQDGVDAVLAEFRGPRFVRVLRHAVVRYPRSLRQRLLALAADSERALSLPQLCTLDQQVAERFAQAARKVLPRGRTVRAIGSHGQTVFHSGKGRLRTSVQLGNPALIAELTGTTTVADFRRADMAAGGQGAPLVPAFHAATFGADEPRAVLNVGGIANVTLLPQRGAVTGFDTGPGNALLDEWVLLQRGQSFDRNGTWAAGGRPHPPLLQSLLRDPFFRRPPPKSTGRSHFNLAWARRRFPALDQLAAQDVQRTFLELTARTVGTAVARFAPGGRLLICGGGAHNGALLEQLRQVLPGWRLESTARHGLHPQQVEAAAFAWLAAQTLHGLPGNVPAVTGARGARILGGIYRR
ncbi:MAG TPA: anhydro-N-acetylmuramic acid kinase [Candidatus Binatia bacterium]|nr:anhydro-N-acetylmuramic acid kinase [Candidatus Binatia bacterium]